jgi:undecaprenyl diphosphate synthase
MPVTIQRATETLSEASPLTSHLASSVADAQSFAPAAVVPLHGATPCPPAHVAIIMDGNGRWAKARGLPRVAGHREGARAVRRTVEAAIECGIGWLTIYAFSSENWRRPVTEILDLTGLLRRYLRNEVADLCRNGVRLRVIGDRARFEPDIQDDIASAERQTEANTRLNLTIALSYGARSEIAAAARAAAAAVAAGTLDAADVTEDTFTRFLATAGMPDPDLIIRTSGEQRLSNFLLWQAAYAELVFLNVLWPDFEQAHLVAALQEFSRRERRFGARAD